MSEQFFIINLREYLDNESKLYKLISPFSCPLNPNVEHFLKHNAIEFTKKDQSVTYLVFRENDRDEADFVGYFSSTVKPVSIHYSTISKSMARKLERIRLICYFVDLKSINYCSIILILQQNRTGRDA